MGVAKRVAAVVVPLGLVIGGVAYGVSRHQSGDDKTLGECTTEVGGLKVILTDAQARNATLISAIAVRRGHAGARRDDRARRRPARSPSSTTCAAATATRWASSSSARPRGGARPQEILDPVHATNAFYDALERVPGYADLRVTVAAQRVQRSGYPSAYAVYEDDARALASAMTGYSPAAFWCHQPTPDGSSVPAAQRARAMRAALLAGVRADQRAGGAGGGPAGAGVVARAGWSVASYVVAHAAQLGVTSVGFRGRQWTAGDNAGWRRGAGAEAPP